ncbi:E3 ubiquitin-protein ligase RDUF2-like [Triticum urartu]|nr:E3 ubiquitin-protein ligase RDUF2-like [Triticum urartu]
MDSSSLHRTEPTDKPAGRSSKSLDTGWIILIVLAVLAAVGLLVLAVCCIRRRKQKPRAPAAIRRRERLPAGTAAVRIGESGAGRLPADAAAVRIDESGAGRLPADAVAVRIGESGAGRLPADAVAVRIGESGAGRLSADTAVVHTGESSGAGEGAGVQATVCPMCTRPYDNEPCRWAPERLNCGHVFHGQCIKPWVAVNLACPVCNTTHIQLLGKTPGDARAARHRYSFSHLERSVTTKDDIAVFRQRDWD